MFKRGEGLNHLERLFKNEEEFVTLESLLSIVSEKAFNILIEDYQEAPIRLNSLFTSPNVLKISRGNGWIEYSVVFNSDGLYRLCYVNRVTKKVIVDTQYGSVFARLNELATNISRVNDKIDLYEPKTNINFTELNDFDVTSVANAISDYQEIKERVVMEIIEEHKEELLKKIPDRSKKIAESDIREHFTLNTLESLTEGSNKERFVNQIKVNEHHVKNNIVSMKRVINGDGLFDLVENKDFFELMYKEVLRDNLLGEEIDVHYTDLLENIYIDSVIDEVVANLEKNYDLMLAREIKKALDKGGKTITVTKIGSSLAKKIENTVRDEKHIGRYSDDIANDEVQLITYGKKVLFDREEFDKQYGYLKSTN